MHLCFSSPCDDVSGCMLPGLRARPAESAKKCGRCRVGQLPRRCSRAQWGLKGMREDMLGPKGGTGKGASSSWQIACLCGSQRQYVVFLLVPISPRLVFHPSPSGCNGVPGCLDGWMEERRLLTGSSGTPFRPLKVS